MSEDTKLVLYERSNPFNDKFTVVRKRVKLTPAVCEECGRDMCEINHRAGQLSSADYDALTPEEQHLVRVALQKHKERFHTEISSRVITASEAPTSYLKARD